MNTPSIIEKKRDGGVLSASEIAFVIDGFTRGDVPDYQMSALAMAIVLRGMNAAETADLTRAMLHSGESFSWPDGSPRKVDKHSTGGIGDKVSLVLAPLLACDDLWVPMISGRGLGITGGTLDKLESIPGFNVRLDRAQAVAQLEKIGVVMIGQTDDVCPADRKLYSLRDVTGTVPSEALIVASIMSKKLAESLDALVLDVKYGSGAFMKTKPEAESLAGAMRNVGEKMGVRTSALLTPMDEPLGRTVGNALEVREAVETLQGKGPPDLVALALDLAVMVSAAGRDRLAGWLADGTAWKKFVAMVHAQGGDVAALDDFACAHTAPVCREIVAPRAGTVQRVDAGTFGRAAVALGAGREKATDAIDPAVGFDRIVKTGAVVGKGDLLARIHARTEEAADEAGRAILGAITLA